MHYCKTLIGILIGRGITAPRNFRAPGPGLLGILGSKELQMKPKVPDFKLFSAAHSGYMFSVID